MIYFFKIIAFFFFKEEPTRIFWTSENILNIKAVKMVTESNVFINNLNCVWLSLF